MQLFKYLACDTVKGRRNQTSKGDKGATGPHRRTPICMVCNVKPRRWQRHAENCPIKGQSQSCCCKDLNGNKGEGVSYQYEASVASSSAVSSIMPLAQARAKPLAGHCLRRSGHLSLPASSCCSTPPGSPCYPVCCPLCTQCAAPSAALPAALHVDPLCHCVGSQDSIGSVLGCCSPPPLAVDGVSNTTLHLK